MQVIPSINVKDLKEAKERMSEIRGIFNGRGGDSRFRGNDMSYGNDMSIGNDMSSRKDMGGGTERWIHIDKGDGIFASVESWGDPVELEEIIKTQEHKDIGMVDSRFRGNDKGDARSDKSDVQDDRGNVKDDRYSDINIEAHLMVENPEDVAEAWLKVGAKRLIVHLEALKNSAMVMDLCQKYEADLMLAINPETIVENLIPYFHNVEYYLILAVEPGKSGQEFNRMVLDKVEFLRERCPGAKIEVDGGINLETAKLAKEAGADYIVSASYVFGADDPREAFQELMSI